MRTRNAGRVGTEPRCSVEDLDVKRRAIAILRDVTLRPEVRERLRATGRSERLHQLLRTDGRRGIEIVASEIVDLANAGADPAELALFPAFVQEIVSDVLDNGEAPDLATCERAEHESDVAEDAKVPRLLAQGVTASDLTERARLLRHQAMTSLQLARAYESEARRVSLGRTFAHAS